MTSRLSLRADLLGKVDVEALDPALHVRQGVRREGAVDRRLERRRLRGGRRRKEDRAKERAEDRPKDRGCSGRHTHSPLPFAAPPRDANSMPWVHGATRASGASAVAPQPALRQKSRQTSDPEEPPMLDASASGVYVIAPTPFHDDGRIDERSIDRHDRLLRRSRLRRHHRARHAGRGAEARRTPRRSSRSPRASIQRAKACRSSSASRRRALPPCARSRARSMDAGAAGVMIAPPPRCAPTTRSSSYYRQARGGDRRRRAVRAAGLSADAQRRDDAGGDPPHRRGESRPA